MTLLQAIALFRVHQKNSVRDKTRESYGHLLKNLETLLGDHALESIGSQDLYRFLITLTEGRAKNTARLRYAQLKALFFTFFIERTHASLKNPCDDTLLAKTSRAPRMTQREIIGREIIELSRASASSADPRSSGGRPDSHDAGLDLPSAVGIIELSRADHM
jgi:site-specific recombinase XerD